MVEGARLPVRRPSRGPSPPTRSRVGSAAGARSRRRGPTATPPTRCPGAAVVRLDLPGDRDQLGDLVVAERRDVLQLAGHLRFETPWPPVSGWCQRVLVATVRLVISPVTLLTMNESGVTSPLTTAEPRPQLASMAITDRSPVSGLRVNITPELRESTIRWTTTAMARSCSGMPATEPVGHRLDAVEARPAAADLLDHLVAAAHPQVGVLQAGEAGIGGILARGAGAHRDRQPLVPGLGTELAVGGGHRLDDLCRQRRRLDHCAQVRAGSGDGRTVGRVQRRHPGAEVEGGDRRPERRRRDHEAVGHPDAGPAAAPRGWRPCRRRTARPGCPRRRSAPPVGS